MMAGLFSPIVADPLSAGEPAARAELKGAAVEFEALFLAQVLRGLTAGLTSDGPLGGERSDPFCDLLTDAYARLVARAGGIGIASAVVEELVRIQERAQEGA